MSGLFIIFLAIFQQMENQNKHDLSTDVEQSNYKTNSLSIKDYQCKNGIDTLVYWTDKKNDVNYIGVKTERLGSLKKIVSWEKKNPEAIIYDVRQFCSEKKEIK